MNKYVDAFYKASEIFEDDLHILSLAFIIIRDKSDKRKPQDIKIKTDHCRFKTLYPYSKKICELSGDQIEELKEKINKKMSKKTNT